MSAGSALGGGAEFDRIRSILARLGPQAGAVGDDCAVLPPGEGTVVTSTDLAVQDVHFRTEWITLEEIGWRAAMAALSDLAAAGADAVGLVAGLGIPPVAGPDDAAELMAGVGAAAEAVGGTVLGGDLSRAPLWIVSLTVLGRARRPVRRRGARPGDGLWVTGRLGGSRAALAAWQAGRQPDAPARTAFARPAARIGAGRALAAAGATAMLDLSDGLGGDAGHLAAASGVALRIELARLPLHPAVAAAAREAGMEPERFAALGGEDYELLAALPPAFDDSRAEQLSTEAGVPLTRIGTVEGGAGVRFRLGDAEVGLVGYDHFG